MLDYTDVSAALSAYIRYQKLDAAVEAFVWTDLSVKEICDRYGFTTVEFRKELRKRKLEGFRKNTSRNEKGRK